MKRILIASLVYIGLALFAALNGAAPRYYNANRDYNNWKSVKTTQTQQPKQQTQTSAQPKANPADYYSKESKNLNEKVKEDPTLSTFASAIKAAGLTDTLNQEGPYTIFIPSNQAFKQLPKGVLERLLKPENQKELIALLSYHIVPGKISVREATTTKVRTLNGQDLNLEVMGGVVTVDDAEIIQPDVKAKNGIIHVIDEVLAPTPTKK